jgi:hypothetical protein
MERDCEKLLEETRRCAEKVALFRLWMEIALVGSGKHYLWIYKETPASLDPGSDPNRKGS